MACRLKRPLNMPVNEQFCPVDDPSATEMGV